MVDVYLELFSIYSTAQKGAVFGFFGLYFYAFEPEKLRIQTLFMQSLFTLFHFGKKPHCPEVNHLIRS